MTNESALLLRVEKLIDLVEELLRCSKLEYRGEVNFCIKDAAPSAPEGLCRCEKCKPKKLIGYNFYTAAGNYMGYYPIGSRNFPIANRKPVYES